MGVGGTGTQMAERSSTSSRGISKKRTTKGSTRLLKSADKLCIRLRERGRAANAIGVFISR